jgi:hypothetical protein
LASGGVAVTSRKHVQGPLEPLRQPSRTENADPRGGKLDRERYAVKMSADVVDRFKFIVDGLKVAHAGSGSLDEQRGGVRPRQRPEREDMLGPDPQRRLAGDDESQVLGARG